MSQRFDYIIVGAGSAGCLLANRLSACGRYRVLLLEAGPSDTSPLIRVPIGFGPLFDHPRLNWGLQSEPEPELNSRTIAQPRGKVLGGSSALNGMMYVRGQPQDYDGWAALGNTGWSWQEILPYFLRSEDNKTETGPWHAQGGEMAVSPVRYRPMLADAFIEAAGQAGIPRNADINSASQEGIDYTALNQQNGARVSAARAFLKPVRSRNNLTVMSQCRVDRVLIERSRARGVELQIKGQKIQYFADREVLLCSGALHTPHLLQLSGVGCAKALRAVGVPLHCDLPGVGANLQEHLGIEVRCETRSGLTLYDEFKPHRLLKHLINYAFFGRGLLTFNGALVSGFTALNGDAGARPDCQLVFSPAATAARDQGEGVELVRGMTSMAYPLRPDARGSVELRSANPEDPPRIRHNFLRSERDSQQMIAAVKLQRRVFAQVAIQSHISSELAPGKSVQSDEQILDYIRNAAMGCYHPVGSCRMGQDDLAVVDTELRVHGLTGLRVIDASIMPTLVSGNTNAAVTMIAEKGAAMVLSSAATRPN